MGARTKARKRALDVLFEAEQRQLDPVTLLAQRIIEPGTEAALPQYSVEIVEGVVAEQERIDELIEKNAKGWKIDRMKEVERGMMRIGKWEII